MIRGKTITDECKNLIEILFKKFNTLFYKIGNEKHIILKRILFIDLLDRPKKLGGTTVHSSVRSAVRKIPLVGVVTTRHSMRVTNPKSALVLDSFKVTFQANLEIVTCEFQTRFILVKKSQKGPKFRMHLLKCLNLCTELCFFWNFEFLTLSILILRIKYYFHG